MTLAGVTTRAIAMTASTIGITMMVVPTLAGPTSRGDISETNTPDRDDERWPERDRDPREDEHVLPVLQSEAAAGMDAVLEPGMGLNLVWPAAVTDQTVVP